MILFSCPGNKKQIKPCFGGLGSIAETRDRHFPWKWIWGSSFFYYLFSWKTLTSCQTNIPLWFFRFSLSCAVGCMFLILGLYKEHHMKMGRRSSKDLKTTHSVWRAGKITMFPCHLTSKSGLKWAMTFRADTCKNSAGMTMIAFPLDTYLIQLVLIKNVCTQKGPSATKASNSSST